MKWIAALPVAASLLMAQGERPDLRLVTAVRHWSVGDATRVSVEISGGFEFRFDRLHDPERVYYDILNARPRFEPKRPFTEDVDDKLLKRVRVAETQPGVTRIVLDLATGVEASATQTNSPNRLEIELRIHSTPAIPTSSPAPEAALRNIPAPPKVDPPGSAKPSTVTPIKAIPDTMLAEPSKAQMGKPDSARTDLAKPDSARLDSARPDPVAPALDPAKDEEAPRALAQSSPIPVSASASAVTSAAMTQPGKAARHTIAGDTSLVRALGLKLQRIVIDPGHGGHDEGTQGPKGLLEKELVLDVALRVGKLIQEHMGTEVIYTRTDDTFIPLEGRTALANDKKADLFLSIHANSSPVPRISGVETFYLNFTDSKDALDVASRENASSQKSIFELRDIIQQISLHDKAEESREFANRVQTALFGFSTRNFPAEKNRGVKKAPFLVLIGANMPSVLAEIGFLSNPREEALLKRQDYRQKLADALYRGVSKYADSLSHFQVAQK